MPDDVWVRPATSTDRAAVANVLDGAALELDPDALELAIGDGAVLVAVAGDHDEPSPAARSPDTDRVLGALVLDGAEILAVAVRRRRRDQGIGTALVEAAGDRRDRLEAEFDGDVRPFWSSLGFEVETADEAGRLRGVR